MNVYVIGPAGGPYKVGFAKDIRRRLSGLQVSTYLALDVQAVAAFKSEADARAAEQSAHKALAAKWISGEWFGATLSEIMAALPNCDRVRPAMSDERRIQMLMANLVGANLEALASFYGCEVEPEKIARAALSAQRKLAA